MVFHMNITDNQNGFALVVAMLCMAILTFIGMYALNTTNLELQIAGNDKVARQSFYKAEGGIQTGIELTEQNLGVRQVFQWIVSE
jgi:Tfp pilus assembly protein PilX